MKKIILSFLFFYSISISAKELYLLDIAKARDLPTSTVIVLHGCAGPNRWTEHWASTIKKWGYNVVVPNQFSNRGYQNVCNRGHIVSPKERSEDIPSIVNWVVKQPWHTGKIAVIGASHGGSTTAYVSNDNSIKDHLAGTVLFYPSCKMVKEQYSHPVVPSIVYLGAKDKWTPCLDGGWENYEKYVYPEAGHAFDINQGHRNFMGHELWYDAEAAQDSEKKTKLSLNKVLNK